MPFYDDEPFLYGRHTKKKTRQKKTSSTTTTTTMNSLLELSSSTYDIPVTLFPSDSIAKNGQNRLENQPWFHGLLTRIKSEGLVRFDGDFLVRDSISSLGEFVLTCYWHSPIHFRINRVLADGGNGQELFQFEAEQFQSIVDLIQFYQSHSKLITEQSGCLITNPVTKIVGFVSDNEMTKNQKNGKEIIIRREIEANYAAMNHGRGKLNIDLTKRPLPTVPLGRQVLLNETRKQLVRENTPKLARNASSTTNCFQIDPNLCADLQQIPSAGIQSSFVNNDEKDDAEYCEMDYEAMDCEDYQLDSSVAFSAQTPPNCTKSTSIGSVLPPPLPPKQRIPIRDSACVADFSIYDLPNSRTTCISVQKSKPIKSMLDFDGFSGNSHWNLLENLPICEIARLFTQEDCRLLRFFESDNSNNGLMLLLLPHGTTIREDIHKRVQITESFVAISIVSCSDIAKAAQKVHIWIEIARELLLQFGNVFSFVNIMTVLEHTDLKQIPALWSRLKADSSSFGIFKNELLPALNCLRKTGSMPENAVSCNIPYLQPMIFIFDQSIDKAFDWLSDDDHISATIDTLWLWLEKSRKWAQISQEIKTLCANRFIISSSLNPLKTEVMHFAIIGSNCKDFSKQYANLRLSISNLAKILHNKSLLNTRL